MQTSVELLPYRHYRKQVKVSNGVEERILSGVDVASTLPLLPADKSLDKQESNAGEG